MTFKIQIPQISPEGLSTKDWIINILSTEWPLTLKQIHRHIVKNGVSITYQAVHKSMQALLHDRVISGQDRKYFLDENYLKQIKDFSIKLEQDYQEKRTKIFTDLNKNRSILLNFEKQIDRGRFLFSLLSESHNENIYFVLSFVWCPLTFSKIEYEMIKNLCTKNKVYLFYNEDSELNRYFAKIWRSYGIKVKRIVNSAAFSDLVLYQDLIIQVFIPEEMGDLKRKEIFKQSVTEIDLGHFYEFILEKKFDVPMLLIKDQALAEQLRKKIEVFKRGED